VRTTDSDGAAAPLVMVGLPAEETPVPIGTEGIADTPAAVLAVVAVAA
jgi:hypothetical protein